jgi:hypothetical protein
MLMGSQLTSALPEDANVYGLGEVVSTSGFRRDISENGTLQTWWSRDDADPTDKNMCVDLAEHSEVVLTDDGSDTVSILFTWNTG